MSPQGIQLPFHAARSLPIQLNASTQADKSSQQGFACSPLDQFSPAQRLTGLMNVRFGATQSTISPEHNLLFELKEKATNRPHEVAMTQARGLYKDPTSAAMLTNQMLFENVLKTARVLKEKYNIQRGDKIATIDTNTPEFFMTMYAAMALGASVVPINLQPLADRAGANEKLAYMLNVTQPKAVFIGNTVATDPDLSALTKIRYLQPLLRAHRKAYVKPLANMSLLISKLCPGYFTATRKTKQLLENITLMINSLPTNMKIVTPKDTQNFNMMLKGKPLDEKDIILTPDPKSTALILYTSGTTSMPKALPISHEALVHNVQALKDFCTEITAQDRHLVLLPQFHIFGLVSFFAMLSKGVTNVLAPSTSDAARNPRELLDVIEREKITVFPCVPKIFERLFKQEGAAAKMKSIRILMAGGEKLSEDVYRKGRELLSPEGRFWQGYGSTEALVHSVNKDKNNDGYAHVGECISPDGQMELKDPNADGKAEIWLKSPSIGSAYLALSEEANAERFKPDGWYATGDLGQMDGKNLKIVGRLQEIIKRGGDRVAPEDFELRMKTFLVDNGKKIIKDALCFSYTPPGTEKEKVMAIFLMENAYTGETAQSLNDRLQVEVKAGKFAGFYVPDYILPITDKNFPEGFITAKKEYKKCRAYLDKKVAAGELKFGPKGMEILKKK